MGRRRKNIRPWSSTMAVGQCSALPALSHRSWLQARALSRESGRRQLARFLKEALWRGLVASATCHLGLHKIYFLTSRSDIGLLAPCGLSLAYQKIFNFQE